MKEIQDENDLKRLVNGNALLTRWLVPVLQAAAEATIQNDTWFIIKKCYFFAITSDSVEKTQR